MGRWQRTEASTDDYQPYVDLSFSWKQKIQNKSTTDACKFIFYDFI